MSQKIKLDTIGMMGIHDPSLCEGKGCSVHHPSDHHMSAWPIVWREDLGYCERMCPHGIGHPDYDDMVYLASIGDLDRGIHSCDRCCSTSEEDR